jgi:hypothetical protein
MLPVMLNLTQFNIKLNIGMRKASNKLNFVNIQLKLSNHDCDISWASSFGNMYFIVVKFYRRPPWSFMKYQNIISTMVYELITMTSFTPCNYLLNMMGYSSCYFILYLSNKSLKMNELNATTKLQWCMWLVVWLPLHQCNYVIDMIKRSRRDFILYQSNKLLIMNE